MSTPPGWPEEVPPPEAQDWERRAVAWLFDLCPADYRSHDVLRTYPVVLARFAAGQVAAAIAAADNGLATVRAELGELVPPEALDAAIAAYEREAAHLVRTEKAVGLVEQALRGQRFVPRL